jgi:hypothetical protein
MSESTLEISQKGFAAFVQGFMTGNFQLFLNMLTDGFIFWHPYGKYRGKFSGRNSKAQIVSKCRDHTEAGDRLTFSPPHHIAGSEITVMFEFECEGVIGGEDYRGRIALVEPLRMRITLDASNDKNSGFREYFSDLDK